MTTAAEVQWSARMGHGLRRWRPGEEWRTIAGLRPVPPPCRSQMPRETRGRRLTRTSGGVSSRGGNSAVDTAPRPLISLLAHASRIIDVLPHFHQHALEATGGICSLLFEQDPRVGAMQATSGFGLEALPTEPLNVGPDEDALIDRAFARRAPMLVPDAERRAPELASRLGTRAVMLLPLAAENDRVGLLVVGFEEAPDAEAALADATEVSDAFLTALELFRQRQTEDLRRDLGELINEFGASLAATLNLAAGLENFCHGVNRLFGADRTSVWIHDRKARHLVLRGSSDAGYVARGVRVSTDDPLSPAASAMRTVRAEIIAPGEPGGSTSTVTVPLRGTRRALGTIVFDGVRVEPGRELALLNRADELGSQLSSAIENVQLLDDLLRSRRELENTFDSIADLVAVSDRRGRIVHANLAFASRVGSSRDELVDRPLDKYIGPELTRWLAEHESQSGQARGDEPSIREIADPALRGSFIVTITDLLNQEREPVGSVIVARDLTPQTRLEAEREELRRRLTQSEKLAALGQFVAGIAHELNNPLQGVLGHLELMRATGAFPKNLRREVQTIYREADRAAKIVRNLLVFAGSRRLARRRVSLNAVLQKVVALRAPACRAADIEVVRHYDENVPRVESDPLLLHQAFLNIVMNAEQAVAATGGGGRIDITTSVSRSADRVVVTVRDTGVGIPAGALSRIFEPFYTTKEVGKGTGLGLAIAYGIVQEHGGQIVAVNHPDGGALFTVELPAGPAPGR
jgi:PAS domain S-box-containing protein